MKCPELESYAAVPGDSPSLRSVRHFHKSAMASWTNSEVNYITSCKPCSPSHAQPAIRTGQIRPLQSIMALCDATRGQIPKDWLDKILKAWSMQVFSSFTDVAWQCQTLAQAVCACSDCRSCSVHPMSASIAQAFGSPSSRSHFSSQSRAATSPPAGNFCTMASEARTKSHSA